MGARHYIDSSVQNVAEALTALGGAKVILATVTSGKAMSATIGGLAVCNLSGLAGYIGLQRSSGHKTVGGGVPTRTRS